MRTIITVCLLVMAFGGAVQAASVKLHIKPVYEEAYHFSNGLARVRMNSLYGYIDRNGSLVIPARFDKAGDFENERANVRLYTANGKGKWGVIDSKGNWIVKNRYDRLSVFRGTFAVFTKGGQTGVVDRDGKEWLTGIFSEIIPFRSGIFAARQAYQKSWILYNQYGLRVNLGEFRKVKRVVHSDALIAVKPVGNNKNGLWGFIDASGEWVVKPAFRHVHDAPGVQTLHYLDLYRQFPQDGEPIAVRMTDKWGYTNAKGELLVPFRFFQAGVFVNGLAKVDDYITINRKGETASVMTWLPPKWSEEENRQNLASMMHNVDDDVEYVLIPRFCRNAQGKVIKAPDRAVPRKPPFDQFTQGFSIAHKAAGNDKVYKKQYPGLMGVIGPDCQWAYPPEFDYISRFVNGFAVVAKNNRYGYLKIIK